MKTSNTFNPRSDRQSWELSSRVPEGGEGLTGRLDYRHDALLNAGSLPQWSRSFMLHPKVLETGEHLTPLLTVLLFKLFWVLGRSVGHVRLRCGRTVRLVGDSTEVGQSTGEGRERVTERGVRDEETNVMRL
jgi:hypothetical protein